jgi:hypothetical protein
MSHIDKRIENLRNISKIKPSEGEESERGIKVLDSRQGAG